MNSTEKNECILCKSKSYRTIALGKDYEYNSLSEKFQFVSCNNCNHHYLNPRPCPQLLPIIYPSTYYTVNPHSPLYLRGFAYQKKLNSDVRRILKYSFNPTSVLDVGCGNLNKLIKLKQHLSPKAVLTGLDLGFSEKVKKLAMVNHIMLIRGNIELPGDIFSGKKYDVVIMSQLLEHLYDPLKAIQICNSIMARGSLLFIETPNLGGLDHKLFQHKYWGGYHFPRHFNIFSQKSLENQIKKAGFRILKSGFLPSPGFWIISLRNVLKLNSRSKSRSITELINFKNVPLLTFFSLIDYVSIFCGQETSNQFLICQKE